MEPYQVGRPSRQTNQSALADIDERYQSLGCLGHGGFGSVFLARKKSSGRRVAIKMTNLNPNDQDHDVLLRESFQRELDAVRKLNFNNNLSGANAELSRRDESDRDLSIVFFRDWFMGNNFACIVMNYCDGGTLEQEIEKKKNLLIPGAATCTHMYSERRVAWYALQLSEALAYAHERGVSHHDVKSANVLIDWSAGGKLLLADFGCAVAPGEESVGMTERYASPELQTMYFQGDFTALQADKVDAFGLGCVIFELLSCQLLADVNLGGEETLSEFIIKQQGGVDAALDLDCIQLPWLPQTEADPVVGTAEVGYSYALRSLVKTLLEPNPVIRWSPSDLAGPLRNDPRSPLLLGTVVAAQTLIPGEPVTIDNIRLGMFVQRGKDWIDENEDGGLGSVGVITKLDSDGYYTQVSWPSSLALFLHRVNSMCCRIGSSNKFELQVGPKPIVDFFTETNVPMETGLVHVEPGQAALYQVGKMINPNCIVVGKDEACDIIFVAPLQKISLPQRDHNPCPPPITQIVEARRSQANPEHWNLEEGNSANEVEGQEREGIINLFLSNAGDMHTVTSILRIENKKFWRSFSSTCEDVASENWGIGNRRQLFSFVNESFLRSPTCESLNLGDVYSTWSRDILFSAEPYFHSCDGERKVVLSRVELGRVESHQRPLCPGRSSDESSSVYHSLLKLGMTEAATPNYMIRNPTQAYPEYIITFSVLRDQPSGLDSSVSSTADTGGAEGPDHSPFGSLAPQVVQNAQRFQFASPYYDQASGLEMGEGPFMRSLSFAQRFSALSFQDDSWPGSPRPILENVPFSSVSSPMTGTGTSEIRFQPIRQQDGTMQITFQSITAMPRYSDRSFEELRLEDYMTGNNGSQGNDISASNASTPSSGNNLSAFNASASSSGPGTQLSSTKQCVVCMERDVRRILLPCGHPNLCEHCSTPLGLLKLKHKCPECRCRIEQVATIYARVVDD
jgi:serine/threonine protein kinase